MTYNQIIERNQEFSDAHRDLNNFGVGGDFDMVLGDQENPYRYNLMWMEDLPSPIETGLESFNFRVYFLGQVTELEHREGDLISTNRNEVISNMRSVAIDFLSYWKQLRSDNNVRFSILTTINVSEDITPDKLYGVNIDVSFKVLQAFNKCIIPMSGIPTPESQDVSIYGNDTLMVTVACGNNYEFEIRNESGDLVGTWNAITKIWTVPDGGGSASIDIAVNGTPFYTGVSTNQDLPVKDSTGANNVGSKVGSEWRISDTQVILKNTANETLNTQNFYAESQANEMVADNVTSDFNGVTLLQETPSGQNKSFSVVDSNEDPIGSINSDLPNSTQVLVSDSVVTIGTQSPADPLTPIRSQQNKTINLVDAIDQDPVLVTVATDTESLADLIIPNSQVLVKDSAGTTLHTKVVKAGGSANQTVSDVTQTLNGSAITNNKAQTSKAITIRYANNDPVVVTTITDTETVFIGEVPNPLNTSNPFKTGQTTSYVANDDGALERGNGVSFITLSHNNYFGNTNRFTDELGGQTYTNGWIIDWSSYNQVNGNFIMWNNTYEAAATWANALAAQPYTRGSHADWYLPNESEIYNLLNRSVSPSTNYAPFNINVTSNNNGLWTTTTVPNNTLAAYYFSGSAANNTITGSAKTANQRFILMRYGNISEL